MTGGHFNDNGQVGIGAWKADEAAKIIGAEVAGNNYANFERYWDAGGLKITPIDHPPGAQQLHPQQQGCRPLV